MSQPAFLRTLLVSLSFLALTAAPAAAQATTYTWTGGDADDFWISPLNWSTSGPGGTPPLDNVNDTFLVLDGTARTTNVFDYSFGANALTFALEAGAFTVGTEPGVALTLGVGGLTVAGGNANPQAFNANLVLGAAQTWANNGSAGLTIGGAVDNGGFLLTAGGTGASSYTGVVSGAGGLTKTGAGSLTLSSGNTFTGTVTVSGGTLRAAADSAFGAVPGAATAGKLILDGGTLAVANSFTISANRGIAVGPATGTGSGTIDVAAGQTLTYAGIVANNGTGVGGLNKTGAGTLTLGGANTFSGPVLVSGGVLSIGSTTQITPAAPGSVTLDGGTLRHTSTVAGTTFITTSHAIVIGANGGTIDIPSSTAILSYSPAATGTFITPSVAGTGVITKTGAGTFRLTQGGFTANTTVQKLVVTGGLWQAGLDTAFGAVPGAVLADQITLNGGGISSNAGFVLNTNRGITVGAGGGVLNASSGLTYNGKITGVGAITKTGASSLILGGASNDYAGGTTITAGTLQLAAGNNRLPAAGNLAFSGGTLDLNTRNQSVNALTSTGAVGTITTVAVGSVTLTVGNGNGVGTFGGVIQNGGGTTSLIKTGTGTQTFAGTNTYTGTTAVNGGTLAVNGSLAAGSAVTVNTGGLLAGTGTVNGTVTVADGGAVRGAIGTGTAALTVANNVSLNSTGATGSILQFAASRTAADAADASRINLTGLTSVLNLNPGLVNAFTIDLVAGTNNLQSGETYSVLLATVAAPGNIQLNSVALNANDPIASGNYVLISSSYANFTGVSLTIDALGTGLKLTFSATPVPEPATALAVAAGVLGFARIVRRRSGSAV